MKIAFIVCLFVLNFFLGMWSGYSLHDIRDYEKQEKEYELNKHIKKIVNEMQEHN